MNETFPELTGWSFSLEEVSACVYEATGRDAAGRSVSAKGTDPDEVLRECRATAARISGVVPEPKG
jgi:hypothetical protein